MFGISPTKNKMAIVCQSRGSRRPYLYGSRVQNMQRHARIFTGPAGRGLMFVATGGASCTGALHLKYSTINDETIKSASNNVNLVLTAIIPYCILQVSKKQCFLP